MAILELLIGAAEHVPIFSIGKSLLRVAEGDIDGAVEVLAKGVGRSRIRENIQGQHDSDTNDDD